MKACDCKKLPVGEAIGRTTTPGVTAKDAGKRPGENAVGAAPGTPVTAAPGKGPIAVPPGENTGDAGTCNGDI